MMTNRSDPHEVERQAGCLEPQGAYQESAADDLRTFLVFLIDKEQMGVEISAVHEIIDSIPVTWVPDSPDFMLGVVNLRGNVVPVLDLQRRFGREGSGRVSRPYFVILDVLVDGERTVLGVIADSVLDVITLHSRDIEPTPGVGARMNSDCLLGITRHRERFVLLLDLNRVFSSGVLSAVEGNLQTRMPA